VRSLAGFPAGIAILTLLVIALGLILAPVWVPFVHGGAHLGFWRPHTVAQSFAVVPAGLILLPATLLIINPVAGLFGEIASGLLGADEVGAGPPATAPAAAPADRRRSLRNHGAGDAIALCGLGLIWAVTSRGYFWPVWIALPLLVALAIHGWFTLLARRPALVHAFRGSRALAGTVGVGAVIETYFIAVWAITGHGYFWPIWTLVSIGVLLAAVTVAALLSPDQAEMAERIETLETSRAGAVDLRESELRRIERDLHDGAQARLVALGMSLGMAEQKLADDPQRVGELIAEARAGAEHALRELRDLARGIHPPVLADRGLEAALASLASSTPIPVTLSVDTASRPVPAVETAAYFVAAEALTNAAKHAHAEHVEIRITHTGEQLELEVRDDGTGGANPDGGGLRGMRHRVEALDGKLFITSPRGGPTIVRAELPCAS
jgi:signal transduction histidine kinase